VNGAKKMDYGGPTLYAGQGCYLKLANYHTGFGRANSVIHARVIRATAPGAVSRTPLEGVLPGIRKTVSSPGPVAAFMQIDR
jgi:hypothetical protein